MAARSARAPGAGGAALRRRRGPRGARDTRPPARGGPRVRDLRGLRDPRLGRRPARSASTRGGRRTRPASTTSRPAAPPAGSPCGPGSARRRLPQRDPRAVLRRLVGRVRAARAAGRARAPGARGRAALGLAKSAFSRRDLEAAGRRCSSCPSSTTRRAAPPSPVFARLHADGPAHVLAVGRLAPNKRLEDLLRAFALLQRGPVPRCRLLLVGDDGLRAYAGALRGPGARAAAARRRLLRPRRGGRAPLRLRARRRPRLALRARGLRRTSGGGDARRRPRRRLRRGGGGGDDGRRGRAPRDQAPRARGRRRREPAPGPALRARRARRAGEGGGAGPRHGLPAPWSRRPGPRAGGGP